jgi:hypothetical protein
MPYIQQAQHSVVLMMNKSADATKEEIYRQKPTVLDDMGIYLAKA